MQWEGGGAHVATQFQEVCHRISFCRRGNRVHVGWRLRYRDVDPLSDPQVSHGLICPRFLAFTGPNNLTKVVVDKLQS